MKTLSAIIIVCVAFSSAAAASPGEQLFQAKCKMCHKVKGAGGAIGPDLSRVGSSRSETFLIEKLENPKKLNPASSMPSYKSLSQKDKKSLVDYLKSLR